MPIATFSGLASGIDSASLIEALIAEKKKARVQPLERQIAELNQTNDALRELKTKASQLRTAAQSLSALYGGPMFKKATSTNTNVATATASSNVSPSSYTLNITQLASVASATFNTSYNSNNDFLIPTIDDNLPDADRTITISFGQGSNQVTKHFVITSTTRVSDFLNQFNGDFSGLASAMLVNVGTGSNPIYRILIQGIKTGTAEGELTISYSGSADPNLQSWVDNKILTQAQNLTFTMSGISGTITKSQNSFSDVISGLNVTVTDVGTTTINVTLDTEKIKEKVQEVVNKYNELVRFVNKQNRVTQHTNRQGELESRFGRLFSVKVDESLLERLRSKLASIKAYDDPPPPNAKVMFLMDIGIKTTGKNEAGQQDGSLEFDPNGAIGNFFTALNDDPVGVKNLLDKLGTELSSTTGILEEFIGFNKLIDNSINTNQSLISNLERDLTSAQKALLQEEENLRATFARLESLMGRLRSVQTSLAQALNSLPSSRNRG